MQPCIKVIVFVQPSDAFPEAKAVLWESVATPSACCTQRKGDRQVVAMPAALVTWQEGQEGASGSCLSPLSAAAGMTSSVHVGSLDELLRLPLQPQRCQRGLPQGASRASSNCQSEVCI